MLRASDNSAVDHRGGQVCVTGASPHFPHTEAGVGLNSARRRRPPCC